MQLTPINKHFNACDQQWDEMPQQDNGRHCQQCDRVLIDLTDKTEQQVLDLQVQHNFKLCGRYTLDQVHRLDRYLTLQEQPKRSYIPWLVKLAMGLGASGLPMVAAAQEPLPGSWIDQPLPADTLIDIYPGYHSPWVRPQKEVFNTISGVVKDSTDGEVLPFVNVTIVDADGHVLAGVTTDIDGRFQLKYQEGWLAQNVKLRFSYLGYEHKEKDLTDIVMKDEYEESMCIMELTTETMGMLGFIIVDPSMEVEIDNYRFERDPLTGAEIYKFD